MCVIDFGILSNGSSKDFAGELAASELDDDMWAQLRKRATFSRLEKKNGKAVFERMCVDWYKYAFFLKDFFSAH